MFEYFFFIIDEIFLTSSLELTIEYIHEIGTIIKITKIRLKFLRQYQYHAGITEVKLIITSSHNHQITKRLEQSKIVALHTYDGPCNVHQLMGRFENLQ